MAAFLPMAISALSTMGGAYLASSGKDNNTRTQGKNKHTVDEIMAGLKGEGPYADIYSTSDEDFQKYYVDPAKSTFKNQIAPQIQQSYIASGLQRGTGLDDSLSRAGVDMDQMINSAYMDYMNNAMNRRESGIKQVLGADVGGQQLSGSDRFNQAAGGYLQSPGFKDQAGNIADYTRHAIDHHSFKRPGFAQSGLQGTYNG